MESGIARVAGEVKLAFELWVDLETGLGLGLAQDPLHPEWEFYFTIASVEQQRIPKGLIAYKMRGIVTRANAPTNVGIRVRIYAETDGRVHGGSG